MLFNTLFAGIAAAQLVAGHGAIIKAVGDMGGNGSAIGIDSSTPRDGSRRTPFQADSTRFKNNNADACGETIGGGPNEPMAQMAKVVSDSNGLPMVSAGGMIMMTLHQVNNDGAGPYDCMIDSTGTGTGGWTKMEVTTNVPGKNSRSRAKASDFPLTAKIDASQTCTGSAAGMSNVCMVRCNNAANAGPFGGCVPVSMVQPGGGASGTAGNPVQSSGSPQTNTVENSSVSANSTVDSAGVKKTIRRALVA